MNTFDDPGPEVVSVAMVGQVIVPPPVAVAPVSTPPAAVNELGSTMTPSGTTSLTETLKASLTFVPPGLATVTVYVKFSPGAGVAETTVLVMAVFGSSTVKTAGVERWRSV